MKRFVCVLLVAWMFFLCGCTTFHTDAFTFFYPRTEFAYTEPDGIIGSEQCGASGHASDTLYLLSMYLNGSTSRDLTALFPQNTQVVSAQRTENRLQVQLTCTAAGISDSEYSLACACLALTCIQNLGVEEVTVSCGAGEITLREDTLLLYEDPFPSTRDADSE